MEFFSPLVLLLGNCQQICRYNSEFVWKNFPCTRVLQMKLKFGLGVKKICVGKSIPWQQDITACKLSAEVKIRGEWHVAKRLPSICKDPPRYFLVCLGRPVTKHNFRHCSEEALFIFWVANIVLESSYPCQLKIYLYSEIVAGDDQRAPELKRSMNKQTAKMTKFISIMDFLCWVEHKGKGITGIASTVGHHLAQAHISITPSSLCFTLHLMHCWKFDGAFGQHLLQRNLRSTTYQCLPFSRGPFYFLGDISPLFQVSAVFGCTLFHFQEFHILFGCALPSVRPLVEGITRHRPTFQPCYRPFFH